MMRVIIRADASLAIGSGHVMRCLTLAEALRAAGHTVAFICRAHDGHLSAVIAQAGFEVFMLTKPVASAFDHNIDISYAHSAWLGVGEAKDFADCQPILADQQPDWLIIDHYAIGKPWQQNARQALPHVKILVIDDLADRAHDCDVLLDQNFGRQLGDYQNLVPSNCRLLLGTRYALLRDEFRQWREKSLSRRKHRTKANTILVNLGGVDQDNITLKILQCLNDCMDHSKALNVTVVMGKTAPHSASVQAFAKTAAFDCQVIINAHNMAELMAQADVAIGAAGSTTWERCCLGLPSVLLVLADNQRHIAAALQQARVVAVCAREQLADDLPDALAQVFNDYAALSRRAAALVDGRGATRVVNAMSYAARLCHARVRRATVDDMRQIWQWRNHDAVRQWMFGQDTIAWASHQRWFSRQLAAPNVRLLMFLIDAKPMGFVNITCQAVPYQTLTAGATQTKRATWGFYLAPDCPRGQGWGFALAVLALADALNADNPPAVIDAQVLAHNTASIALHRKLGFVPSCQPNNTILPKSPDTDASAPTVLNFVLAAQDFLF